MGFYIQDRRVRLGKEEQEVPFLVLGWRPIGASITLWTNAEVCLLATKGKPKRASASVHSVIDAPIGRHSEKPAETRDRIVRLAGGGTRIELFARQTAPGWDAWGDEVEGGVVSE